MCLGGWGGGGVREDRSVSRKQNHMEHTVDSGLHAQTEISSRTDEHLLI